MQNNALGARLQGLAYRHVVQSKSLRAKLQGLAWTRGKSDSLRVRPRGLLQTRGTKQRIASEHACALGNLLQLTVEQGYGLVQVTSQQKANVFPSLCCLVESIRMSVSRA